jgi:Fe-S-cluster containining protein
MVMLTGDEIESGLQTQSPMSGLLKQGMDGFCHYLDRDNMRCSIWQKRPFICRAYNCNTDPKLQVVVRKGLTSFTQLIEDLKQVPKDQALIQIPYLDPKDT